MLNYQIKTQNIAYPAAFLLYNRRKPSSEDEKRDLPKRTSPFALYQSDIYSSTAACAAAKRELIISHGEILRFSFS
jgi:hypothetical protein